MARSAVFIDGGYFDYALREVFGKPRLDYEAFSDALCEPDRRLRTYWYNCPPWQDDPPTGDQRTRLSGYQSFTRVLNMLNRFTVREGRLQNIEGNFTQKGVDVLLAVDAVRLAHSGKADRIIMITADSDFVPVVRGIEGTGVVTALCYSPELAVHNSLLEAVDERLELSKDLIAENLRD